jgi:hypothetical protein
MKKLLLAACAWCALFAPARAADQPKPPPGYTCEDVRQHVARYGRIASLAWAKLQGATKEQISEARKCLARN